MISEARKHVSKALVRQGVHPQRDPWDRSSGSVKRESLPFVSTRNFPLQFRQVNFRPRVFSLLTSINQDSRGHFGVL